MEKRKEFGKQEDSWAVGDEEDFEPQVSGKRVLLLTEVGESGGKNYFEQRKEKVMSWKSSQRIE